MQAQPYVTVEGTVVGHRVVEIEAEQPREYTDRATGEVKTTRGRPAFSYTEVGVNTAGLLNGQVHDGVTGVLSVRWPADQPLPADGEQVRWALLPSINKLYRQGRGFIDWIVYNFAGQAAPASVAAAPSRHLIATGA